MPVLLIRYLPQIIGFIAIVGALWWLYSAIYDCGYSAAEVKYGAEIDKIKADGEEVLRKREVELEERAEKERIKHENAEKEYAATMVDIANTPKPSSLPIRTKNCSSGNTVPRDKNGDRQETVGEIGLSSESRLPERNTELLNSALVAIKILQAECKYIRDRVEFDVK